MDRNVTRSGMSPGRACAVGRALVKECHQFMRNELRLGGLDLLDVEINRSRARGSLGTYGARRKLLELCFLLLS